MISAFVVTSVLSLFILRHFDGAQQDTREGTQRYTKHKNCSVVSVRIGFCFGEKSFSGFGLSTLAAYMIFLRMFCQFHGSNSESNNQVLKKMYHQIQIKVETYNMI